MPTEVLSEKITGFSITETEIKRNIPADQILAILRTIKTNGELRFVLSEGGIRQIFLKEKTKMTDDERHEIQKIMNRS